MLSGLSVVAGAGADGEARLVHLHLEAMVFLRLIGGSRFEGDDVVIAGVGNGAFDFTGDVVAGVEDASAALYSEYLEGEVSGQNTVRFSNSFEEFLVVKGSET